MERKSIQLLEKLRKGDRFTYLKRADVWQVMLKEGNHIEVNQIVGGKPHNKFNDKKSGSTRVMFLRHTIPVSGEVCFIEDLQEGDVFWKQDDVVTEYLVVTKGHDYYKVRRVHDKACAFPEMAGRLAQIVFVRNKEEDKQ
jgi:hypothetical protein